MSKFAIIIPIYKNAVFVTWVVESLISQSFRDWEAILVDDCSEDPAVTQAMQDAADRDSRIRLLFQSTNQGQSVARNRGLSEVDSDYVIFLDFDDLLFPWSLQTMCDVIDAEQQPAFLAGSAVPLSKSQESVEGAKGALSFRRFRDYFEYRISEVDWWFVPSGAALKTSLVKQVGGFWDTRVYFEDIDLWNRLGNDLKFVRIDSPPVYGYRLHAGSAHHDWFRMHEGLMRVIGMEKSDSYPGGRQRKDDRIQMIASHARHHAVDFVSTRPDLAVKIYAATIGWNLKLSRWKFLLGLPLMVICSYMGWRNIRRPNY